MDDAFPAYSRFECSPGLKLAAHEKVCQIQHENIIKELGQMEEAISRLEKRLWMAVYGVVGAILAQTFQSIIGIGP